MLRWRRERAENHWRRLPEESCVGTRSHKRLVTIAESARIIVSSRGSALLEQLLALSLLGLLIAAVFGVLATGSLTATIARNFSLAGGLAAGKLEEVSARCEPAELPLEPVDRNRFPRYQWQATVTEIAPGLCNATVTVWWPERGRQRRLTLMTLIRREDQF